MSNETGTMSVGDCMGNSGPLPTVAWNGKVYKVFRNCPEVVAHMETAVAKEALAALKELKAVYEADEYAAREKGLHDSLLARHHGFGGPLFMAALTGPKSVAHLLHACIKPGDESVTLADAVKMVGEQSGEVIEALILAVPDFFDYGADKVGIPREQVRPQVKAMLAKFEQAKAMLTGQPKVAAKRKK